MKAKIIILGGLTAVLGLLLLGFSLGAKGYIGFDVSAGQATVLKAEGQKALDLAAAAAIDAETARRHDEAAQALATKKQTDEQWVTTVRGWLTVGMWTGSGLMVSGTLIVVYFLGHGAWIANDRRHRAPIVKREGSITVTVLPTGITTWHDDQLPGWTVHCNNEGVFGTIGPNGEVLIGAANARAVILALQGLGYNPRQAAKAYNDLRQALIAPAGARIIEATAND